MSIGHLYVLFREVSVQVLCPFFNWVVCVFHVEFYKFFINFGYEPLMRCISKYVLPFCGLSLYFVDVFLCCAKTFQFGVVLFVHFWFVSLAWGDISEKIFLWAMSKILLPSFSSRICMVWGLTFKSSIHFEFILVCGIIWWPSFIFLHISVQYF